MPRQSGSPKSRKTFWGEEEQRRERTFRALHGNERNKVCDDEAKRRHLTGVEIEKRDSEKTTEQLNSKERTKEVKIMVIKITPKQSKRINALIRKLCCNYVDGNCLLLDDGEEHSCVQCISRYGIYCNYFKNAVLPADRELFAEIMQPSHQKRCQICKSYFVPKAKNQRYCPNCAAVQKRKKAAERQRRKRAAQSLSGFRTES